MDPFEALFLLPPVIQELQLSAHVKVQVLREDLRHAVLGGNKLWKLKYNLENFSSESAKCIVTFGGAFSNHLLAISEVCFMKNIPLHVFIRGEEQPTNTRIDRMKGQGTFIHYLSREDYRKKQDASFIDLLLSGYGIQNNAMIIPEGANNTAGQKGCSELAAHLPENTTHFMLAVGTGGTLHGITQNLPSSIHVVGIPVGHFGAFEHTAENITIFNQYAWKGYGKSEEQLDRFIVAFSEKHNLPLEPIYTGKLFYALQDLLLRNYFPESSCITVLHSGGLG